MCNGAVKMDNIQRQYMRISHNLMCLIGQWPYQETWEKFLIQIVFVPVVFAQGVLQGGGMITAMCAGDIDVATESLATFVISLMCVSKYVNYSYNHDQMKKLVVVMAEDWNLYSKFSDEYNILCKNYAMGKKVAIIYAASLYGSMAPFSLAPLLINAASFMGLTNLSDERPLMYRTEYFVDSQKYYYSLLMHSYIGTFGFLSVVVAIDSLLVFHVQHECSLCEILGYRLARIVDATTLDVNLYPSREEDIPYKRIKNCAIIHNHIIEYAKWLDDANMTAYFFQLGCYMIGITFTVFQASMKLSDPQDAMRYASFAATLLAGLFLESWPGQQLTDKTDQIFRFVTDGQWYQSPLSVRKVINIMLMKSQVPIKITAGKLYAMNYVNFSAVVRTSFSYFTVLCSMQ